MTRALIAFLALAGCTAQADEPSIGGFEKLRIESYATGCLIKFNTDQCLEACKAAFPDDGSDGNQERWLICSIAVLIVIGIVGGWVYLKFFGAKQ